MIFTIQVNNRNIKAEKGETILSALNRNGIIIPTLCRMKDFTPSGACRMCVVEIEGKDRLVTACSQPVEEWMKIKTHSPRVITARRTIVELLLANHPDDCLYCDKNLSCELQKLAGELNIRERKISGGRIRKRLDQSSFAIVRELSKCILCGRCVRICEEVITASSLDFINRGGQTHIGATMDRDLNFSSCIQCGQCVLACPTGALHEKHCLTEVQEYINSKKMLKVIQYSPIVSASIAFELGIKYSRDFDRNFNAVLRKIGFDKVFKTGAGTDLYISESTDMLMENLENNRNRPFYISACPGWIKYAEQFMPEVLPELSPVKSPQQITGSLIKTVVADEVGLPPEKIYSVAVTPCTAMKFEAGRDGMMRKGISDVDAVMTVREIAKLIRLNGIDASNIDREPADEPLNVRSSLAVLAEVSGGLTEGILRTLFHRLTGEEADRQIFKKVRSTGNFRECTISAGKYNLNTAVIDGLKGLKKLKEEQESGKKYDLIEVMVCPGGCIHGAGLPFISSKEDLKARAKLIYQSEETEAITLASKSPSLINLYDKIFSQFKEISEKKIFYTNYEKRNVLL
jgi:iron-only hydrogenase group A